MESTDDSIYRNKGAAMTQQKAKVTRLIDEGRAEVAVRRQSACGHNCATCGGGCSEMMVEIGRASCRERVWYLV